MAHSFEVEVRWKDGLRGESTPLGVPVTVPFSVPREFGGPGGEWTPEHFLSSAVASCVLATFLSIAQMSKLAISAYEAKAVSTMDKVDGALRITQVDLSVKIAVKEEKDRERAQRMIEKAEKLCPISNSLKVPVGVSATVVVA